MYVHTNVLSEKMYQSTTKSIMRTIQFTKRLWVSRCEHGSGKDIVHTRLNSLSNRHSTPHYIAINRMWRAVERCRGLRYRTAHPAWADIGPVLSSARLRGGYVTLADARPPEYLKETVHLRKLQFFEKF